MNGAPLVEARRPPGLFRSVFIVLAKDLVLEWRTRARLNALLFFALCTMLLFSIGMGAESDLLKKGAAGFLTLAILFASVLSLGESFRVEVDNSALDGLRLAPTNPRAIFLGKALGNAALLFFLTLVMLPIMVGLFDVELRMGIARAVLVMLLASLGIAAPGTIYAAISSNVRARDVLLPLLLFPVLAPALIATVKALGVVLSGDFHQDFSSWLWVLSSFDLVYWMLGFLLFPIIVED